MPTVKNGHVIATVTGMAGAMEAVVASAAKIATWGDGKLMHLGYNGVMPNTHFLFCSQSSRGIMHQTSGAQMVANAVPTCIACIGTVLVE